MNISFEKMAQEHGKEIIDIFNYYVENSFAAYPDTKLSYEFFGKFLEITRNYPAYAIIDTACNKVIGFCFLHAYNPFPVFSETAEISYFIDREYVGKGIGKKALSMLEAAAAELGIKKILASISSENSVSLSFHGRNGFVECGRFSRVGKKLGRYFDIVWMIKEI